MHVEKLFQYEYYNLHQFNELFRKIKIGTLEKFENKTTNIDFLTR